VFLLHASVHPPETKPQDDETSPQTGPETANDRIRDFRHSGWAHFRDRVNTALHATGQSTSRIHRFQTCGENAWVVQSSAAPIRFAIHTDKCHDRFCSPCATEHARTVARGLAAHCKNRKLRFVTLTLKTDGEPLRSTLDRLLASFRRLRSRLFWSRHVSGGAAFLEVKWNPDLRRWHPHLHVLVEGSYMAQKNLREEWRSSTGDSYIVDIRDVPNKEIALGYVAKYASKGYDASILKDPLVLAEAMLALHGRRLMMAFKGWRRLVLSEKDQEEGWNLLCPLSVINRHAESGDEWCLSLIAHLRNPHLVDSPGKPPDYLSSGVLAGCSRTPDASRVSLIKEETIADDRLTARSYMDHYPRPEPDEPTPLYRPESPEWTADPQT